MKRNKWICEPRLTALSGKNSLEHLGSTNSLINILGVGHNNTILRTLRKENLELTNLQTPFLWKAIQPYPQSTPLHCAGKEMPKGLCTGPTIKLCCDDQQHGEASHPDLWNEHPCVHCTFVLPGSFSTN